MRGAVIIERLVRRGGAYVPLFCSASWCRRSKVASISLLCYHCCVQQPGHCRQHQTSQHAWRGKQHGSRLHATRVCNTYDRIYMDIAACVARSCDGIAHASPPRTTVIIRYACHVTQPRTLTAFHINPQHRTRCYALAAFAYVS